MGCNCGGGRSTHQGPGVLSLAHDGRKVEWWVGEVAYQNIADAKVASDATGEPIRRIFAS